MEINIIDIDKLVPYSNNPRKNSAVNKVAASIKEFGFRQPIVVDPSFVVVVGHTRLAATKKLNMTQVPVHIAHNLTDKQIAAYRLADNRTNEEAIWDNEKLYIELKDIGDMFTGFDKVEIKTLFARHEERKSDPDEITNPLSIPKSKQGDIYTLGNHRLICGDSTDPQVYNKLLWNQHAEQ